MSRLGLTPRQTETFVFVERYIAENGRAPSTQEIADAIGVSSLATAYCMVTRLVERGWLLRRKKRARSLRVARGKEV